MAKQKPMPETVAEELAIMMQREIDSPCPEESMSCSLGMSGDFILQKVEMVDGLFTLDFSFYGSKRVLRMKPVSWSKE